MFGIQPIFWVLINSTTAFLYLFLISKVLGKKQIAQLEFIDYTVGITLGSISAQMATDAETPFYYYLIGMSIFFILALLVAILGRKNTFFKRVLKGKPSTLIYEGKIVWKELKKNKIDVNDLISMLREKNYFNIDDVAYAIFEPSGELSILPKSSARPVTIADIDKTKIEMSNLTNILIVDGTISKSGLNEIGKNKEWLFKKLSIASKKELKNIVLTIYNSKTKSLVTHYKK